MILWVGRFPEFVWWKCPHLRQGLLLPDYWQIWAIPMCSEKKCKRPVQLSSGKKGWTKWKFRRFV